MNILNPNKYIRSGMITALKAGIPNLNIWYKKVPVNVVPIPSAYILLDSQTKNETVVSKSTTEKAMNFEWLSTIDVNIYSINKKGYSNADVVDDMEQSVLSIIRTGFNIPNFDTKNVRIIESQDLSIDNDTASIDRKLVKFEIWLNNVS